MTGGGSKMKTLRQRILTPFLILMVFVLLLLELIMFNIYTLSFQESSTQKMNKMLENITITLHDENGDPNAPTPAEVLVTRAMRQIKSTSSVEIVFYDAQERVIFLNETTRCNTFLREGFVQQLQMQPSHLTHYRANKFNLHNLTYFCYAAPLKVDNIPNIAYIGMCRHMELYDYLTSRMLGLILLVTVFLLVAAALLVTLITRKITQPINKLESYVLAVRAGEEQDFTPSTSSVEIHLLGTYIQQMVLDLQQAEQDKKAFYENVSHELRTPIMALQGYAQGLSDGVFEDSSHAVAVIYRESCRLSMLVEQLMMLAKIDNQVYKQVQKQIYLKDFLDELADSMAVLLEERGLHLVINAPDDVVLLADWDLLRQVLSNPISNCMRYAQAVITVTVTDEPTAVRVLISDDGAGFSEEILPHLFERFYKGAAGHVGLGMAIAKTAALHLRATMRAYNDHGATVEVIFPQTKN